VRKRQKKRGKSAGRGPELIAEESCLKEKREKQYRFPPNEQSLKFVSAKILPLPETGINGCNAKSSLKICLF